MQSSGLKSLVLMLLAGLAFAGCGSLLTSDRPAMTTWWLAPLDAGAGVAPADAPELSLALQVVPGLATERILTLDGEARLRHIAGARWSDDLPEVLGSVLRRSLATTGHYSAVTLLAGPRREPCRLELEAQEFFAMLDRSGAVRSVRIKLAGHYRCHGGSRTVQAGASAAVGSPRIGVIVASFQRALDEATRDLIAQMGSPAPR